MKIPNQSVGAARNALAVPMSVTGAGIEPSQAVFRYVCYWRCVYYFPYGWYCGWWCHYITWTLG